MKILRIILCLLTIIFSKNLLLAQNKYAVKNIPKELLTNAKCVIREDETVVEMERNTQVIASYKSAITILREADAAQGYIYINYDKDNSIDNLKAVCYDADGNEIRKFGKKDFEDVSAVTGYTLYTDDRVKVLQYKAVTYPVTIAYEYTIKSKGNMLLPEWQPNNSNNVAVEKSKFMFTYNSNNSINLSEKYLQTPKTTLINNGNTTLSWSAQNLPATNYEPYAPKDDNKLISVKIVPNQFSYYGHSGSFTNWDELSKWVYNDLLVSRQNYTPAMQKLVQSYMVKYSDKKALTKAIYNYVQRKIRYVSVQIGIGGWQPTAASDVDHLGYADCKGLVNYMQTLLNLADIPSYYCIVNAGDYKKDIDTSLPTIHSGNHAILAVPFTDDTLWFECTNNYAPDGFLGDFTDDRIVWAINKDGGHFLKTPKYGLAQNSVDKYTELWIDDDGNANGYFLSQYGGTMYDAYLYLMSMSDGERTKALTKIYNIDHINFNHYSGILDSSMIPIYKQKIDFSIPNYGAKEKKSIFLYPNLWTSLAVAPVVNNRNQPFYINRSISYSDTITLHLPKDASLSKSISKQHIKEVFGNYDFLNIKSDDGGIMLIRKCDIIAGTYPVELYEKYRAFTEKIYETDKQKVVLSIQ